MTSSTCGNYYEILEVSRNATHEEIKKAFRLKALELHPDINNHPSAVKQFKDLKKAYDCLTNISTCKNYSDFIYKRKQAEEALNKSRSSFRKKISQRTVFSEFKIISGFFDREFFANFSYFFIVSSFIGVLINHF